MWQSQKLCLMIQFVLMVHTKPHRVRSTFIRSGCHVSSVPKRIRYYLASWIRIWVLTCYFIKDSKKFLNKAQYLSSLVVYYPTGTYLLFDNIFFQWPKNIQVGSGSSRIRNQLGFRDPDPELRLTYLRIPIRICIKYLWIWNTACKYINLTSTVGSVLYCTKYKRRHIFGTGEGNLLMYNMWSEYWNFISNARHIYIARTSFGTLQTFFLSEALIKRNPQILKFQTCWEKKKDNFIANIANTWSWLVGTDGVSQTWNRKNIISNRRSINRQIRIPETQFPEHNKRC